MRAPTSTSSNWKLEFGFFLGWGGFKKEERKHFDGLESVCLFPGREDVGNECISSGKQIDGA